MAEINPSLGKTLADDDACSFIPMESVDEVLGQIKRQQVRRYVDVRHGFTPFREGDAIVAKITPCMENGKAAVARGLTGGIGFGSTEFHVVRPSPALIGEWFHYFWRLPETRWEAERHMTGSAGQKRVPEAYLEELHIPLPTRGEQELYVALLRRADHLRRMRRVALELSEGLLGAVFLEMFGDPIRNPHELQTESIGEACVKLIDYRGRTPKYSDDGIHHVTAACIKKGAIDWRACKYVTEETFQEYMTRGLPQVDDVLFTTEAPLGETTVVKTERRFSLAQRIVLLRPKATVRSDYLSFLLGLPDFRPALLKYATGTTVKGISSENLQDVRIPIPQLQLQQRFCQVSAQHRQLCSLHSEALRQAEHLFQTLLHDVFEERV